MQRLVKFLGTDTNILNERLPIIVNVRGMDTQYYNIDEGQTKLISEEAYQLVKNLVAKSSLQVINTFYDIVVKGTGVADVWDATLATPTDKVANVVHSLNLTSYSVILGDANYEIINKTVNSFDVKLKVNKVSAGKDINYAIVVEQQ